MKGKTKALEMIRDATLGQLSPPQVFQPYALRMAVRNRVG